MGATVTARRFVSRPLPPALAGPLRVRLRGAHRREPFSAVDTRGTIRRVRSILSDLGVEATVYRGGLDLQGSEVDHVWLDVGGRVVDVAFPLYVVDFVAALRCYVTGDVDDGALATVAAGAGVEDRVVGEFPAPLRYVGGPVWSARAAAGAPPAV